MTFALQLRQRRNYLGYKQHEMASLLSVSRSTYVKWERGLKPSAVEMVGILTMSASFPKVERERIQCPVDASQFWPLVVKDGPTIRPELGACWTWNGRANTRTGYGYVHHKRKPVQAHRISFAIHNGGILEGLIILHKCDNKRCVNPAHLKEGTNQDNLDDLVAKRAAGMMPK